MSFTLFDSARAVCFALALTFLSYSAAAFFTLTEPHLPALARDYRYRQAITLALPALVFAALYWLSA